MRQKEIEDEESTIFVYWLYNTTSKDPRLAVYDDLQFYQPAVDMWDSQNVTSFIYFVNWGSESQKVELALLESRQLIAAVASIFGLALLLQSF